MKPVAYLIQSGYPINQGNTEVVFCSVEAEARTEQLKQRGYKVGILQLCKFTPELAELVAAAEWAASANPLYGNDSVHTAVERLQKAVKAWEASK